ncbi:MAG: TetR/AcrR family transcriptional regulator [Parvibaculaceae bacterium]
MAYRQTETVAQRLAENRRRILDAARDLVSEGGFAKAQITAVAKRAGLATGTLYRYFPSKDDLCRQVFREVSSREMNLLAGIAASERPALDRLERVLRSFSGRALKNRRLAYALLAEPVDVALAEERTRFRRTHAAIFTRIIDDAIAEGSIAPCDSKFSAACMAGAIPTALIGPLAPSAEDLEADTVLNEIVRFCFGALGASPETLSPHARTETRL